MKKWISLILCAGLLSVLTACGSSDGGSQTDNTPTRSADINSGAASEPTGEPQDTPQQSVPPEDAANNSGEVAGNTESVAKEIQSQTSADIFEIVPTEAYTNDYNTLLDVAQKEQRSGARPEINSTIENFSDYDVIYLGFPNWWGDMPMILYTFFDEYDLSGKTLAPFCTSGGSSFSRTLGTMETLEPDAVITEGLHIRDSAAGNPGDAVADWLAGIGIAE